MPRKWSIPRVLAAASLCALCSLSPVRAAEPSNADLEAVVRTLGFLETLRRDGPIFAGIVYAPNAPGARVQAVQVAERLSKMQGPNKAAIRATPIAADAFGQSTDQSDVIYLMPGVTAEAQTIVEVARRRHLVTISNDPACLGEKCCVLMVRTDHGVEIVLQTALADAVGARFSAVFSMMVKRQ
jgi:hypothetical protein